MAPLKRMTASAFLKYKSALNRNICQIRLIYATATAMYRGELSAVIARLMSK